MGSWRIDSNGGDHWKVESLPGEHGTDFPDPQVKKYFVTSYGLPGPPRRHPLLPAAPPCPGVPLSGLSGSLGLMVENDVEKVVVVILDKEHRPVEKFVFEITQPPLLSISSDSLLSHVEQLLRAFILKISVCDAVLDHNPPGCTFTVLVHTREAATRNMEKIQVIKDFPWILADEQDVHMHDPRLIPLKTMTSDILKMQLYVEERAHKSS
ncbi:Hypothetical predicted protein [Marmota monax]|uniref:Mitotic spindle assembly checkpoint protein MAD2B n=1 Tax=Marmota monax TaxID=9995 RepID=A0A5E4BVB3_MARMO|nr:Hypothetical predicted protein [Marmota monax]